MMLEGALARFVGIALASAAITSLAACKQTEQGSDPATSRASGKTILTNSPDEPPTFPSDPKSQAVLSNLTAAEASQALALQLDRQLGRSTTQVSAEATNGPTILITYTYESSANFESDQSDPLETYKSLWEDGTCGTRPIQRFIAAGGLIEFRMLGPNMGEQRAFTVSKENCAVGLSEIHWTPSFAPINEKEPSRSGGRSSKSEVKNLAIIYAFMAGSELADGVQVAAAGMDGHALVVHYIVSKRSLVDSFKKHSNTNMVPKFPTNSLHCDQWVKAPTGEAIRAGAIVIEHFYSPGPKYYGSRVVDREYCQKW